MKTLFATVAVAAFSTSAFAGGEWSGNGKGMGMADNAMIEVAEGHMIIDSTATYEDMAFEGESPMNGSTGSCRGAMEVNKGAVSGGGFCAYSDPDGDMWVVRWMAEGMNAEGAVMGKWEMSSGTGKYDGATGGGEFSSLTDPATGKFVNTVSADVKMP